MDKLSSVRIKQKNGSYSNEIPLSVTAENVVWDSSHNLVEAMAQKLDIETQADNFIGVCSTEAATANKVVTLTNDNNFTLRAGVEIYIKFTYLNTAENPTLNVSDTGAKSIWYNGAVVTVDNLDAAGINDLYIKYIYDGTYWVWSGYSTTTKVFVCTNLTTAAEIASAINDDKTIIYEQVVNDRILHLPLVVSDTTNNTYTFSTYYDKYLLTINMVEGVWDDSIANYIFTNQISSSSADNEHIPTAYATAAAIDDAKSDLTNTLTGLINAKQDALTFDSTPTSGSLNPVTSGGVYAAIQAGGGSGGGGGNVFICTTTTPIADIGNAYVSGKYVVLKYLISNDSTKCIYLPLSGTNIENGSTPADAIWEFSTATTSFNSGADTRATYYCVRYANGAWQEPRALTVSAVMTNSATAILPADVITNALGTKQNALTFDSTPTANSTNPVTSGGIKTALDAKQDTPIELVVSIFTSDWNNNTATITTSESLREILIVNPEPSSASAYTRAKIKATANTVNTITFTCETAPSSTIVVDILTMDASTVINE